VTDGAGEGLRLPFRELVADALLRDDLASPLLSLVLVGKGGLGGNIALTSDRSSSETGREDLPPKPRMACKISMPPSSSFFFALLP